MRDAGLKTVAYTMITLTDQRTEREAQLFSTESTQYAKGKAVACVKRMGDGGRGKQRAEMIRKRVV